MAGCAARRVLTVPVFAAALLAGCGDDDADPSTATAPTTDASEEAGVEDTLSDADPAEAEAASDGADRCPLSAEDVGGVLGVAMTEASCTFFPADGDVSPSAIFVRQVPFACDPEIVAEVGYEQTFDGLGVEAHLQPETTFGAQLLVCTEAPFEVVADIPGDVDASIAASEELAQIVLSRGG